MKLTYKYALSTVFAAMLVTPAFAQPQGYSDVPENHWAYEALVRLKREGLLVGYPDGEFKGRRLTTRYELASAIYAVYTNLRGITDSLDAQIKALNGGTGDNTDTQALRDQLAALQSDVAQLKGYGDEIATLRRLVDSFQKELESLGVDVKNLKDGLSDLQARVDRLEKKRPSVEFSGDANLFVSVGFSDNGGVGVNSDGKVYGFNKAGQDAAGLEDLSVLHDLGVNFRGTNETGPQFKGTVVIGNGYNSNTGTGFGNQSDFAQFVNTQYDEGDTSIFLQNLEVSFPTKFAGVGVAARIGRLGYKVSPMILQRPDVTTFYKNDRWDNGLYAIDGAELGVDFGGGKFTAVLARTSDQTTTNTNALSRLNFQNLTVGGEQGSFLNYQGVGNVNPNGMAVARLMGVNFATEFGNGDGAINASYLIMDANQNTGFVGSSGRTVNRAEVFGGDISYKFFGIGARIAYGQTNYNDNNSRALQDDNNKYYEASATYSKSIFAVSGGYRHIEAQYQAPGDWGRYGLIRNPTNVEGYNINGSIGLTRALSLTGGYENLEQDIAGDGEIEKYTVGVAYDLPSGVKLFGGYENTQFNDFGQNPDAEYSFATAGIGYNFSSNSTFTFQYQYGDVTNDFVIGNGRGTAGSFRGSFFSSQLSVKF